MNLDPNHVRTRIKALRELRCWTQKDLAAITGMSQGLISYLENGQHPATLQHVQILVSATGTPERFFTAPVGELSEDQLHFRRKKTSGAKSARMVVRKFLEARYVAGALAATYRPRVNLTPVSGPIERDALDDIAVDVRRKLGFGDEPIRHMIRSCERAGFPVVAFSAEDGIRDDHAGVSYTSDDGRGVIAYRAGQSGDRLRMTVGHELAHRLLHVHRDLPEKQREKEAFYLSGALFLPRDAAIRELSESLTLTGYMRVKATWGVSIQALIMRAFALGIIDADRRTSLMMQLSHRGWRTNEPVSVGVERPALLWHMLTRRYGANSYRHAENDLGQARMDLIEWIPPLAEPEPEAAEVIDFGDELARRRRARASQN